MPRPAETRAACTVSQREFSTALSDPDRTVPGGIAGPDGKKAARRFNVYRNNVTVGLVNALADIFPAVHRLVGDRFFRDMARIYCRHEPPDSPLLFRYGSSFPVFLERFEPVAHLAYLPDVARIELAWLEAYHAADAPVLEPAGLAAVPADELDGLIFERHPACHVVRSSRAAVSIFEATRAGSTLEGIDPETAEDGLITRSRYDIGLRRLPPGGAVFLHSLTTGCTLGEAADRAVGEIVDFDLAAAISAMLEAGVFTGLRRPDQGGGE